MRVGKESDEKLSQRAPQCNKTVDGFEEAATDGVTESSSQRGSDGIPGNCKVGDQVRLDRWERYYKISKEQ